MFRTSDVHMLSAGMAAKGKVTNITKDDQTSRRKRTKGLIGKSYELGIRPNCKVFTFVLYTDTGQIHSYNSTGGAISCEIEAVLDRLRHYPTDWQKSDPSSFINKARVAKSANRQAKVRTAAQVQTRPSQSLRPAPVFDVKMLPMYCGQTNMSTELRRTSQRQESYSEKEGNMCVENAT